MSNGEVLQQLNHIHGFQINDLRRADAVGVNFLVCVGCLNATEVVGGIRTGLLGKKGGGLVTKRLESGIDLLGGVYVKHKDDVLDLRHSMVHAYIGKVKNYADVEIINKNDPALRLLPLDLGIQIVNGHFTLNVSVWLDDLERAWHQVMQELQADKQKLEAVAKALERLPYLR